MRVGFLLVIFFSALTTSALAAQQRNTWQREEKSDPLHGTDYTQFTLEGKYLVAPRHGDPEPPLLILQCTEGGHQHGGKAGGKLLAGYFDVDAALDFQEDDVLVEYRLDDGKLQQTAWSRSTDGGGASFDEKDVEKLLYGSSRKESTNPPVRKVILGVPERLGSEIEAEFNMPDPSEVAGACGIGTHKK
jgi:hypothetical protein